ncbi:sulfur oxidation c-type cytochrome SoxX [Cupriavidus sp. AU9028]|uniref:sulfur oxidation c-type cytochrome SoxX n=1 Tax=Cupriavidus sp. AU9028 TaxID=2871157 RepID=UPI00351D8D8F
MHGAVLAAVMTAGAALPSLAAAETAAQAAKGKPARQADARKVALPEISDVDMKRLIANSFTSKGPATIQGVIERDQMQTLCSEYPDRSRVPEKVARQIEAAEQKNIRYPEDGRWLGDWKAGEQVAQNGRGMQFSDKVGGTNGGNCYACHQMTKAEISFGNIGPSLYQYGKLRGNSEAVLRYTWGKIWDSSAFAACSNMPRFGHKGILTEQQIRDVMALLLDPASPVNQ